MPRAKRLRPSAQSVAHINSHDPDQQAQAMIDLKQPKPTTPKPRAINSKLTAPICGRSLPESSSLGIGETKNIRWSNWANRCLKSPARPKCAVLAVPDRDIQELREPPADPKDQQKGEIATAYLPGYKIPCRIERIDPVGQPKEGENVYKVYAALDSQPQFLRQDMQGQANIDVEHRRLVWIWTASLDRLRAVEDMDVMRFFPCLNAAASSHIFRILVSRGGPQGPPARFGADFAPILPRRTLVRGARSGRQPVPSSFRRPPTASSDYSTVRAPSAKPGTWSAGNWPTTPPLSPKSSRFSPSCTPPTSSKPTSPPTPPFSSAATKKCATRELQGRLMNILFPRIPLWDPDRFLRKWMPVMRVFLSPFGAILWLIVVIGAIVVIAPKWGELQGAASHAIDPTNWPFLWATFCLIKLIHELGHGFSCRRFGGEIHELGIMFLVFVPAPYVDASSAWSLPSRWQRALVGAGGMIFELFVAAIMAFIWANTNDTNLVHQLAYNAMLIASVSTVIFNANPLLRYDGYYILSDLLEIPNLQQKANEYALGLIKRHVFRVKSPLPLPPPGQRVWLFLYAISSGIYRVFIGVVIIFIVTEHVPVLGILMALGGVVTWAVVPIYKIFNYLLLDAELHRRHASPPLPSSWPFAGPSSSSSASSPPTSITTPLPCSCRARRPSSMPSRLVSSPILTCAMGK